MGQRSNRSGLNTNEYGMCLCRCCRVHHPAPGGRQPTGVHRVGRHQIWPQHQPTSINGVACGFTWLQARGTPQVVVLLYRCALAMHCSRLGTCQCSSACSYSSHQHALTAGQGFGPLTLGAVDNRSLHGHEQLSTRWFTRGLLAGVCWWGAQQNSLHSVGLSIPATWQPLATCLRPVAGNPWPPASGL